MKIIYCGIRAENYDPRRKPSFEYDNFYLTLKNMPGLEVVEYPYDAIIGTGKKEFNGRLLELVKKEKPDLLFAFMFSDEFDPRTLDEINKLTVSAAWFADDHWRIWNYSRHYAPHFTWAITTWSAAPAIYSRYGITNVLRSQWACNPRLWHPVEGPRDIGVSFIGQRNSERDRIVRELRRAGVEVWARGWQWPGGRLPREEAVASLSRSKITLNLNSPAALWRPRSLARILFRRSLDWLVPDLRFGDNLRTWRHLAVPQIKARPFEISGCRTFLISGYADDMDKYYEDGKEMVYYDGTTADLVRKIDHYLRHDEEREHIAQAAYERTLREHTYERRFEDLFRKMGLTR